MSAMFNLVFHSSHTLPLFILVALLVISITELVRTMRESRADSKGLTSVAFEGIIVLGLAVCLIHSVYSLMRPASALQRLAVAQVASVDYAHANAVLHFLSNASAPGQTLHDWQARGAMKAAPALTFDSSDASDVLDAAASLKRPVSAMQQCEIARYISQAGDAQSVCQGDRQLVEMKQGQSSIPKVPNARLALAG